MLRIMSRRARSLLKPAVRRVVPSGCVVWSGDPAGGRVALTFDDGPDPHHTPAILDVLREAGVPATFFVVGAHVEQHPEIAAQMVAGGHELGSHTYSHIHLGRASWRQGMAELEATDHLLRRVDPRFAGLFRPPWGKLGLAGAGYALRRGRRAVLWTWDSRDHLLDGAHPLLDRVKAAPLSPGAILLFHDDNAFTAEALGPILRDLRQRGFSFATVSELLGGTPAGPRVGGARGRRSTGAGRPADGSGISSPPSAHATSGTGGIEDSQRR